MTRGRYISEGYLYFLSHYSRSYQKLFSDDRAQITSLKNVRGSITLKPYRQGYLYSLYSICQWKRNFSAVYCPISTIYTAEQSLGVILSIYRFKRDNCLSENVIFESKTCIQNGQYFERSLGPCECDVRRVERLVPPSLPDENAEDCWRQWEQWSTKVSPLDGGGGGGGAGFNPHYHLRLRWRKIKTRRRRTKRYSTEFQTRYALRASRVNMCSAGLRYQRFSPRYSLRLCCHKRAVCFWGCFWVGTLTSLFHATDTAPI